MPLTPFIIHSHKVICDSCDNITTYDEVFHQQVNGHGLMCERATKLPDGECSLLEVEPQHIPCCSQCFDSKPITEPLNRANWQRAVARHRAAQVPKPKAPKVEDLDSVL